LGSVFQRASISSTGILTAPGIRPVLNSRLCLTSMKRAFGAASNSCRASAVWMRSGVYFCASASLHPGAEAWNCEKEATVLFASGSEDAKGEVVSGALDDAPVSGPEGEVGRE
jgi:hypothetical protein